MPRPWRPKLSSGRASLLLGALALASVSSSSCGGADSADGDGGSDSDLGSSAGAPSDEGGAGSAGAPPIEFIDDLPPGDPFEAPVDAWSWMAVAGSECGSGATAGVGLKLAAERKDVVLFFQGGGACWDRYTCVPSLLGHGPLCDHSPGICLADVPGGTQPTAVLVTHPDPYPAAGGAQFESDVAALEALAMLSRDNEENPFREASFVFVPYCTGDLHAGARTESFPFRAELAGPDLTFDMHFSGAKNVEHYLSRLSSTFPAARRIWAIGVSAGGYGAALNFHRIRRWFPDAEVHLLADSAPMIPGEGIDTWVSAWNMQVPTECADCPSGLPQVMDYLLTAYPDSRMGLLAFEQDAVIRWFFHGGLGLAELLNPPLAPYESGLADLLKIYQGANNAATFILPGTEHVMISGYGSALPEGGYSAPRPSADGSTTLRAWVDAWATGQPGFSDVP